MLLAAATGVLTLRNLGKRNAKLTSICEVEFEKKKEAFRCRPVHICEKRVLPAADVWQKSILNSLQGGEFWVTGGPKRIADVQCWTAMLGCHAGSMHSLVLSKLQAIQSHHKGLLLVLLILLFVDFACCSCYCRLLVETCGLLLLLLAAGCCCRCYCYCCCRCCCCCWLLLCCC